MKLLRFALALVLGAGISMSVLAQGVTTSAMRGKVIDQKGNPLFAATVQAIHEPTGTLYGTVTSEDGLFIIRNMKIGGPYTLKVSSVGYKSAVIEEIYLKLNETYEVTVTLNETSVNINEVVVKGSSSDVMNSDRTGSMTNINKEEIAAMPTIKRSLKDITRLTPESDGNSFGGRNNLYNNFSVDGSIFNNSFGLDYATPGGQADAQPVSLDAIDQVQVSLAPFDVREGGFTGAGVNAVTKSGTNEFKGTAYYYFRNENMAGNKVGDVDAPNLDFSANQFGMSIGGPIVKNKLFFFVNAEGERRNELAHGFVADNGSNTGQANVTSVIEDSIKLVQERFRNYWGYDPGAYQGYNHKTYNNKLLVKLDWNINKNNNFTIRYNMLDAWKDILPHPEAIIGRGPTSFRLPFENSSYRIFNKINSVMAELNSIVSNKFSNKAQIGYTAFRDHREPHSKPFPVVDIFDQNGNLAITAGSEMFSTHNILNQDVFQFQDNLSYFANKHTITGGVNFEYFSFENSFNLFYYPWDMFFSVKDFLENDSVTGVNFNEQVRESNKKDYNWSYVKVGQLALYAQDEWHVNDKFNFTYGLRIDVPMYFNEIPVTDGVKEVQNFEGWVDENGNPAKVDPAQWPKSKILWSPRIGFNYDVTGEKKFQIRGGTGIFSGRIPFVWLGNQAANAGINPGYTFQVNATAPDFHWPQVWKNDIAADIKFGKGWLATIEAIYSKDINAVVHYNYNMKPPSAQLEGTGDHRAMFAGFSEANIYSSDPNAIGFLDAGTIILSNTNQGSQFSLTTKLQKDFNFGMNVMAAYTYLNSKDLTSIPAEIAADAFQRNPVVGNPNAPMLSWSRYGLKHRIIGSVNYNIDYGKMGTYFSLFFEAGKGERYSYVYAGDLNRDNIMNNDLLYVPADKSDIHFGSVDENGVATEAADADAQWQALNAFIEQDPYLKTRRGNYAERNGAMLPWFSHFDLRVMQNFKFKAGNKTNKLQLSLDILNFGNLLNASWGVRKFARTTTPITVTGIDSNNVPYFKFDTNLKDSYVDDVSLRSKWQLQIGLRYIFN